MPARSPGGAIILVSPPRVRPAYSELRIETTWKKISLKEWSARDPIGKSSFNI